MDTNLMKRLKTRAESSSYLATPLMNANFSRSKIINDKIRMETIKKPEKIESFLSSPGSKSQVFKYFLQELEVRLGFQVPNDSIDHAAKCIKDKLTYKIHCSLAELHEFWKKIEKIILGFEGLDCSSWSLGLAGEEFIFLINSNDSGPGKDELAQLVSLSPGETSEIPAAKEEFNEFKCEFNKSALDLCMYVEENMKRQYENSKEMKLNEDFCRLSKKSTFLIQCELEENKKRRLECSQLKSDFEWQKEELRFIVAQAKYKKNECAAKEVILESQISRVRKRRVSMAQELDSIEIENQKLESQKERMVSMLNYLTSTASAMKQKPSSGPCDPLSIQSEINDCEAQLKLLEKNLPCGSVQEHDSSFTQIYRLKTKISSLKSINAINKTLTSATSAKNLVQSLTKIYKISKSCKSSKALKTSPWSLAIPSSPYKKDSAGHCSSNHSNLSTLKTDRSLSVGISNMHESHDEGLPGLPGLQCLKRRELMLGEKEDMAEAALDAILSKMENFDEVSCIKGLKAENRRIKGRLLKKERSLDEELQDVARLKSNCAQREKEVERMSEEVEEERWRILGIVEDAVECLDRFVEDFN